MSKKIIMVVAQEGFRDEELLEPKNVFETNGFDVIIASPNGGICKGMIDAIVQSDLPISEVVLDKKTFSVVVVGGSGAPDLMNSKPLKSLLMDAKEKGLLIGAICIAPMVVASFGIIDGVHATVFKTNESLAMFKKHKINFIDESVLAENNLVTGNGPEAANEFAKLIVSLL